MSEEVKLERISPKKLCGLCDCDAGIDCNNEYCDHYLGMKTAANAQLAADQQALDQREAYWKGELAEKDAEIAELKAFHTMVTDDYAKRLEFTKSNKDAEISALKSEINEIMQDAIEYMTLEMAAFFRRKHTK